MAAVVVWLFILVAVVGGGSARMVPVEYLYPPFNLTYFHFIDSNGVFLVSPNGNFSGAVYNAGSISGSDSQSRFFLCVLHSVSRTPVWTATSAGSTILESVVLSLSAGGLALFDPSAARPDPAAWSTPRLRRPVAALRLLDTGELRLIDGGNGTLWSSYERPTDTLLPGQELRVGGVPLTSSTSEQDLTPGAYRLVLTPKDALLQWASNNSDSNNSNSNGFVTYWALSSDPASVQDSSHAVASMAVNASGIYLLASNGRDAVYRLLFPSSSSSSDIVVKVDPSGRLRALTLEAGSSLPTVWAAPANDCELPLACRSLGICTPGGNGSTACGCPDALSTYSSGGCAPADGSLLVPPDSCNNKKQNYRYVSLGAGIGYPPNKFAEASGDSLPGCRDLCTANCSCLGFFYRNSSSRSCFLVHNQIGSVVLLQQSSSSDAAVGFIKTTTLPPKKQDKEAGLSFITIVFGIVLPTVAAVFIAMLLYAMLRSKRPPHLNSTSKKGGGSWFMFIRLPAMLSSSSAGLEEEEEGQDDVLIPGLPTRFTFGDLDTATDGFRWQIGGGGFGSVFRGELPDRSSVAVKRMNMSLLTTQQGRRQFLTEIAVIGNVHHVNLVKLRGFCAEGARQLLVYEYMNRGSLDQTLFLPRQRHGLLDWPARLRVCIGAARGLAYLHAGCDRKILHCDVKPENILLDDHGAVKIADFGLAKLMSPEQSGLFTTMRGTRGYLAPEWLMNAPITDKADVYSFGMVLLEVVRGSKNSKKSSNTTTSATATIKEPPPEEEEEDPPEAEQQRQSSYFPTLALALHEQGRYAELVDRRLQGRADVDEVARVVRVALCCLHEEAALRPNMTAVSAMLDGSMDAAQPRPDLLRYLRMYGRGVVVAKGPNPEERGSDTTAGETSSWSPPSCVSAQQLSGPR